MNNLEKGHAWEDFAVDYLTQKGLKLKCQNYNCRLGEIDLIMEDPDNLVFVEVRYRQAADYGDSAASVNRQKQRKIINTAKLYLLENNLYDKCHCRFDVVAINLKHNQPDIEWISNAFYS